VVLSLAQFADPTSDVSKRLAAAGQSRDALLTEMTANSPLKVVNGEVYAEFVVPKAHSMEEQRLMETRTALRMPVDDVTLPSLPPLPDTKALAGDGSPSLEGDMSTKAHQ
jgi:hypothetical protein